MLAIAVALLAPAAAPRPTAPGLNHVYVVLDQATFDAIRTSAPLAALLGASDTGLPTFSPPADDTDRFFLRGRQTYLEFFAPANRFKEPVGKVGIGIAADDANGFRRIEAGWRRACAAHLARETVNWTQVMPAAPWYDVLYCKTDGDAAAPSIWAMLYRPEFGQWLTGQPRVDRRAMLASRRGRFDVTGLTLGVAKTLYPSIVSQLSAAGFRRRAIGGGVVLTGDRFSLTILPVAGRSHLKAIDIVTWMASSARLRLGAAGLYTLRTGTAQLQFDVQ